MSGDCSTWLVEDTTTDLEIYWESFHYTSVSPGGSAQGITQIFPRQGQSYLWIGMEERMQL